MQQTAIGWQAPDEQTQLLVYNRWLQHFVIGVGVLLVIVYWLFALVFQVQAGFSGLLFFLITLAALLALGGYGVAFWLLQRGQAEIGSRVMFLAMVVCSSLGVALVGGASGTFVIVFAIPVVSAGLMGRGLDVVFVTIASLMVYLFLLIAEGLGYASFATTAWINLAIFLTSVAFLAVLSWMSGHDLQRALSQSHARATELLRQTEQMMERGIQQVELGSELGVAATQVQHASELQASGATEQASAVAQVSTTIEELGGTARQIAQSSEQVAEAGQQTLENASSGQDAVDASIHAMERIRSRVQDVSSRVLSLGERSQQIGEIIDLIDNISDETHLLALNAAIEAAGAGEYGRRFAVVAAEVKSLANRTLTAAREVKGVIVEIRQATTAAVLAAEEGSKEVERGVELAHRAGQVMDNIVMEAERTAQSAAEIGLATAQQQRASEQVVETMREIAEVARQTAIGAQQMAASAATLTSIADRLHGVFHVDPE